ncbi:FxsA family protein [Acinetobacter sp. B5B]|uniref:FxsA family protein n=1 Tax=Acinetobacter baretiae TaxID=2605383 RepID=UPI0018C27A68|nr:FxsA family protein [Acinetobacter baretiae]MBF7682151.1 FxsA family protein [Acinetobacter baretiae]
MNIVFMVVIGAILEIAVWIGVAQFISGWYVFFWFILAAIIGFKLLRSSTATIMPQLQQMQMTGQMSLDTNVSRKIAMAIAGILLIIPGLISDVIAVLILLPPVQKMVVSALMAAMAKRQQAMMNKMMGGMMGGTGSTGGANPFEDLMKQMQGQGNSSPRAKNGAQVIDGEAKEVNPDVKKINMKDVK